MYEFVNLKVVPGLTRILSVVQMNLLCVIISHVIASTDISGVSDEEDFDVLRLSDYANEPEISKTGSNDAKLLRGADSPLQEDTHTTSEESIVETSTDYLVEDMGIEELEDLREDEKIESPLEFVHQNQWILVLLASIILAVAQQLFFGDY